MEINLGWWLIAVALTTVSIVLVILDVRKIESQGDDMGGMLPWLLGLFGLWLFVFPFYLNRRDTTKEDATQVLFSTPVGWSVYVVCCIAIALSFVSFEEEFSKRSGFEMPSLPSAAMAPSSAVTAATPPDPIAMQPESLDEIALSPQAFMGKTITVRCDNLSVNASDGRLSGYCSQANAASYLSIDFASMDKGEALQLIEACPNFCDGFVTGVLSKDMFEHVLVYEFVQVGTLRLSKPQAQVVEAVQEDAEAIAVDAVQQDAEAIAAERAGADAAYEQRQQEYAQTMIRLEANRQAIEQASLPVETPREVSTNEPSHLITKPSTQGAGARITQPEYPSSSRRAGEAGVVTLQVYVLADGKPGEVKVEKTSGFVSLDESALREVQRNWHFVPGTKDGVPEPMWHTVSLTFRVNN